jgi:hypothetical protein
LDRRLGGSQSRFEHGGEEKNSQPLPGLQLPIIQRYTTELSRFLEVDGRIILKWILKKEGVTV